MANIKQGIPTIIPLDEVRVEDEAIRYETYQEDFGVSEKKRYTLNKAPIKTIEDVTGIHDGAGITFEKGTDYKLSTDSTEIVWLDEDRPDAGTEFEVTYRSDSVMGRFIEQFESELSTVEDEMASVEESKFIDNATGSELDELGKIFGVLGKRRERTDTQYRIYLKSVVQSFISRGTKNDIKTALSAATDVPIADIEIQEKFDTNEYEVNILAATPITGSVVEEVAQIADPSGVNLLRTRFKIPAEVTEIDDSIGFTFGTLVDNELTTTDDTIDTPRGEAFEDIISDDGNTVNDNLTTSSDIFFFDDGAVVDTNLFTTTDTEFVSDSANTPRAEAGDDLISDDSNSSEKREKHQQRWESEDGPEERTWNFFSWTELNDLIRDNIIDSAFSSETVDISPNRHTVTDTSNSFSTVDISPNRHTVTDTSNSFSTVELSPDLQEIADTLAAGDRVELPSVDINEITDVSDIVTLPSNDITANTDIIETIEATTNKKNQFRWEENASNYDTTWNFFSWTDDAQALLRTLTDTVSAQDQNSVNEVAVYWEQGSWDTMTWTVPDDSGKFIYDENEWESSDWGSLKWTPA